LGEDFAGVALGPGVLAGLGDLEGGLGIVAGGDGVVAGEGDAGAEDQGVGVDEAVVARGGEVEGAVAGGGGWVGLAFAEVAGCAGKVDAREFLYHVAAGEGRLSFVEVAVCRCPFTIGDIQPAEHPIAARGVVLPGTVFADLPVASGKPAGT